MRNITNLRAISDQEDMLHLFSFQPVAIGTVEEIDGQKYEVVNNSSTTIVSYAPVQDWVQHLKDYHQFMQADTDIEYNLKPDEMTQEEAKERLQSDIEDMIAMNGVGELFETERYYAGLLDIDLDE